MPLSVNRVPRFQISTVISAANLQQGDVVWFAQKLAWFDVNITVWLLQLSVCAEAFPGNSPSMEKEASTGAANVVPASTFLRKSRRFASALPRISSGAIVISVACGVNCAVASGRASAAGSDLP